MFSRQLERLRLAARRQGTSLLEPELLWTPPPAQGVFRVGRGPDPFAPRPWEHTGVDGTFGNRFDDPGAAFDVPVEECFRTIYCAGALAGAFGETIARFRPSTKTLQRLSEIEDDEPLESAVDGAVDPADWTRGLVLTEWRLKRRVGTAFLDPDLRFVDLYSPETLTALRRDLAPTLHDIGIDIDDVDISAVTSQDRRFTQLLARYVYEQTDEEGNPAFAGIRYMSRLNPQWECWAIFDCRMRGTTAPSMTIHPADADLLVAARVLGLTIEGVANGQYIRP